MARENSPRRGRNAADTAAVAAEVRTEVRLPSESVQFYIAGDILAGYVFVNKRVPLVVTGVTADNFEAVRARLSDLYGDHKTVCTASSEGGVRECALSQLPPGDYEYLRFGGKRLTARRRFDFSDLVEIMMALRAEGGCEWDRAQTHESIRINLIEEAYELVDAIDKGSREMMLEEAGDFQAKDLLTVYALTGGVAAYVELLAKQNALSASKAIRFLFSIEGGWLRAEGNVYLANEFQRKFAVYKEILHAIATGDTKWNEIQDRIPENINSYLRRLEEFRLIERVFPILEESSARKSRYRIADPYMRFWLTFVDTIQMTDLAAYHHWDKLIKLCEDALPQFLGKTLEQWFISSYLESGMWTRVGSWWDRRGHHEIDLIAIDDINKKIVFGEAKLNSEKYDERKLEQSSQAFLIEHKKYAQYQAKLVSLCPQKM